METIGNKIIEACLQSKETDLFKLFNTIARQDFIRIHGPEHHILDGCCLLTVFFNAGGKINLEESLQELMNRGLMMPGATCGKWGVCGAVSSLGAALSIIDGTGPLTTDDSWANHMKFTSKALNSLANVGGPRCCKRDAYLSFYQAIDYINEHYAVTLPKSNIKCAFSPLNKQCIHERCPFHQRQSLVL